MLRRIIGVARGALAPSLSVGSRRRQSDGRLPSTPTGTEDGVVLDGPKCAGVARSSGSRFQSNFFAP
jgi:hypothetical protein